jgi:RNA polymerase primary sigma factor
VDPAGGAPGAGEVRADDPHPGSRRRAPAEASPRRDAARGSPRSPGDGSGARRRDRPADPARQRGSRSRSRSRLAEPGRRGEGEGELGEAFADLDAPDPLDEAEESLTSESVREALDALPARERRIVELRFGFDGEPWTLEAIGAELQLTRERVRQLADQALRRLERALVGYRTAV